MDFLDLVAKNPIFFSFLIVAFFQFFYIFYFYFRLIFHKPKTKYSQQPVSIIITAKNEAENLKKFLPKILQQKYPNFEVIVVNDGSEDDTEVILAQLKQKYSNLYFTTIPQQTDFRHGKKLALTIGIKAAKNEFLLLTDADCQPKSDRWIHQMIANFDNQTNIVIGYGGYMAQKGLLNKLIRTDTVFIALNYFSYALAGVPYMGVGRNMALRKSFFFKVKGFSKHYNLLSGSDDLFVNQNANKKNLKIELHPDSFTLSVPKQTFKEWFFQKQRHFTTAKFYKFYHKALLFLEGFTRLGFWILFFWLLVLNKYLDLVLPIFALRFLLMNFIFFRINKIFSEKKLLIFENLYDILQIPLNFVVYLTSIFNSKNNYIWK